MILCFIKLKFDRKKVEAQRVKLDKQEIVEYWELAGSKKLNKLRKNQTNLSSSNNTQSHSITTQTIQGEEVHTYFSFSTARGVPKS